MKKIGIIGTAPGSREVTPWDDQSWDFWVCSPGNMGAVKRVTAWFELHAIVEMIAPENRVWSDKYLQWLRAQSFPVYMQEPNEHVPQAIVFPYKKLIEQFGTRNWFTSSPAWMLAYAISLKPEVIGIFGVDMAAPQEYYTMQKGGLIYWIERAKQAGIKVQVPLESCLGMPTPLYGYSEASRFGRRMNVMNRLTQESLSNLQQQQAHIAQQVAFHQGALEAQAYFMRTALDGEADAELDVSQAAKDHVASAATKWPAAPLPAGTKFEPSISASGLLVPVRANGSGQEEAR